MSPDNAQDARPDMAQPVASRFEAEGEYDRDDYLEAISRIPGIAQRKYANQLRDMRGFLRLLPFIALFAALMAVLVVFQVASLEPEALATMILSVIMILALLLCRQRRLLWLYPMEGAAYLRHYRNVVDASGVRHVSAVSEAHWQWPAILFVVETPRLLLFFLDRHLALYMPKRHFPDEAAWRACLAFAQAHAREGSQA